MRYPVEVTVKGYKYEIQYVVNPKEVDSDFEGTGYLGSCNDNVIRILALQTSFGMLDTLIHELLHVIFTRNKMLKMAIKAGMEESFIDALATEWAVILTQNGWVKSPKGNPPITRRFTKDAY